MIFSRRRRSRNAIFSFFKRLNLRFETRSGKKNILGRQLSGLNRAIRDNLYDMYAYIRTPRRKQAKYWQHIHVAYYEVNLKCF